MYFPSLPFLPALSLVKCKNIGSKCCPLHVDFNHIPAAFVNPFIHHFDITLLLQPPLSRRVIKFTIWNLLGYRTNYIKYISNISNYIM